MNARTYALCLLLSCLAATAPAQHQSGRSFHRNDRTPATPAAPRAVEATVNSTAPAAAPLARLRTGRAWPRFYFGRLPATPAVGEEVTAADATARRLPALRRGFWRAR